MFPITLAPNTNPMNPGLVRNPPATHKINTIYNKFNFIQMNTLHHHLTWSVIKKESVTSKYLLIENAFVCLVVLSTGQTDVCLLQSLLVSLTSESSSFRYKCWDWSFSDNLDLTFPLDDLGTVKLELADQAEPPFGKLFWNDWGRKRFVDLACRQGPRFTENWFLVVGTESNAIRLIVFIHKINNKI